MKKKKRARPLVGGWLEDQLEGVDRRELRAFRAWVRARPFEDVRWDPAVSVGRTWERIREQIWRRRQLH